jgi:hypothetical protein
VWSEFVGIIIHQHDTKSKVQVSRRHYRGPVYNLEVAQDESYIANEIVVHNCTMIPDVPLARRLGIQGPEIEAGEAWFNRQPEAEQRKRMGPGMHNAWRAGAVRFEQLSHPHEDAVYGTMQREPSLVELLGDNAEGFYVR